MSRSEFVDALAGLPVLDVVTNPESGNALFHLGDWQARDEVTDNPAVTALTPTANSSHSLFVQHCYFELNLPSEFDDLRGVSEIDVPPSDRPRLFNHLIGDRIKLAAIVDPRSTLMVSFESGATLLVATRTAQRWRQRSKYSISVTGEYWTVTADGQDEQWTAPTNTGGE